MIAVFLDKPEVNGGLENCTLYKNMQDFLKEVKNGGFCLDYEDNVFVVEFQSFKEYVYEAKFDLVEKKTKKK